MLTFYHHTGDDDRLGSKLTQGIDQLVGFVHGHAILLIFRIGKIARLGVIGIDEVSHRQHLAHAVDGRGSDTIVEFSLIAHNGIDEDGGAFTCLVTAVLRHDAGLSLRGNEARGNGIELKSQFLPYRKYALDVVGGVEDIELAIVKRVGNQSRGQVVDGKSHIGENGQHGRRGHFPVSCYIIDKKYLFVHSQLLINALRAAKVVQTERNAKQNTKFLFPFPRCRLPSATGQR